jgi:signal-transduction protein with cAMP-binding, CBS, and nucleotidyltransferase domain
VRLAERVTLAKDTILATANSPQGTLYLIIEGEAEVTGADGDIIAHLSRHQFVGSKAFLKFLNTAHVS